MIRQRVEGELRASPTAPLKDPQGLGRLREAVEAEGLAGYAGYLVLRETDDVGGEIQREAKAEGEIPNRQPDYIRAVHAKFDALQTIDRFAKVVAVLNWIADANDGQLPDLPEGVKPVRTDAPPILSVDRVPPRPKRGDR